MEYVDETYIKSKSKYLEKTKKQIKEKEYFLEEKTRELEAVNKKLSKIIDENYDKIDNAHTKLAGAKCILEYAKKKLRHAKTVREKELLNKDKREALAHKLADVFYKHKHFVPFCVVKATIYGWNIDAKKHYFDNNPDLAKVCDKIVNEHYPIIACCQKCKITFYEANKKTYSLRNSYQELKNSLHDSTKELYKKRIKLKNEMLEAKNLITSLQREKVDAIYFLERAEELSAWISKRIEEHSDLLLKRAKEHSAWLEKWYNDENNIKKPNCVDFKETDDFCYFLKHVEECKEHHENCKIKMMIRCPLNKYKRKERDEYCKKYPNGRVAKYLNEKPKKLFLDTNHPISFDTNSLFLVKDLTLYDLYFFILIVFTALIILKLFSVI